MAQMCTPPLIRRGGQDPRFPAAGRGPEPD